MGRENLEVVRALFAVLGGEDSATPLALFDPKIEWLPMEGEFHGIEGLITAMTDWLGTWQEHHVELEEASEVGDQVLAVVHLTARGEASGVEVDQRFYELYSVRDGKIVRMEEFLTRDEALEAAA